MTDLTFGNIETSLVAWLPAILDVAPSHVGVETPANLASRLPFHKVARVGGSDKSNRLDVALVSVDTFAGSRAAARDGCELVRSKLLTSCAGEVGDCVVGRVQTLVAPMWRPYENTLLRRYGATFRITFH